VNSPDLNPIENIWKLVKDILEKESLKSIPEWIAKINEFRETALTIP
jgi:transposase